MVREEPRALGLELEAGNMKIQVMQFLHHLVVNIAVYVSVRLE